MFSEFESFSVALPEVLSVNNEQDTQTIEQYQVRVDDNLIEVEISEGKLTGLASEQGQYQVEIRAWPQGADYAIRHLLTIDVEHANWQQVLSEQDAITLKSEPNIALISEVANQESLWRVDFFPDTTGSELLEIDWVGSQYREGSQLSLYDLDMAELVTFDIAANQTTSILSLAPYLADNQSVLINFRARDKDSDQDGVPDIEDAFIKDATEQRDTDLDGVGDNADAFPDDPSEQQDSDSDGVGDNTDAYPNDANRSTLTSNSTSGSSTNRAGGGALTSWYLMMGLALLCRLISRQKTGARRPNR